jgi:hypothetical protein
MATNIISPCLNANQYLYRMRDYDDAELNELINAGKDATQELSSLKFKNKMRRIKELRAFRRSRFELIRKRAIQLNLTQTDLDTIHAFIQIKNE